MPATAICVVDARASAGETPVWSVGEQCLWWVDIWGRRLHRYDPSARADRAMPMPDIVSFAAPHELGGLAVGLRAGVWHFVPARDAFALIAELPLAETSRFNDAAIFVATHDLPGWPDGACVDTQGRYWMAAVDGAAVLYLDASGQVVDAVSVPVEKPSKPAFGGPALDMLYVTSLRKNLSTPLGQQPLAGGLFAASVDAIGVPTPCCRVALR